jgi:16S rRNA (uracil1498-N3)-methyltransferase
MAHVDQYYAPPENIKDGYILLDGDEYKHVIHVIRKVENDELIIVDGHGHKYHGHIKHIQHRQLWVEIKKVYYMVNEPTLNLTLAIALLKGKQFDWLIEKGTEIGLNRFVPLYTQNTKSYPTYKKTRWKKKAIAAMKQSLRSFCPEITAPQQLSQVISAFENIFIASKGPKNHSLWDYRNDLLSTKECVLVVGPEEGFSDQEIKYALDHGAKPFQLGAQRLKSETAGIVGATQLFFTYQSLQKSERRD